MPIEYGKLIPGQQISDRSYVLDAEMVSAYVDAVGDTSRLGSDEDGRSLAPPTAVAALSLRRRAYGPGYPRRDAPRRPGVQL